MGISSIIAMAPSGVPYFSGNYICPNGNNCHVFSRDKVVQSDPDLISGFLSALMNLAKTTGGQIQKVEFEKFRYLAHSKYNVIMIMITNVTDPIEEYQNRLILCLDLFEKHFAQILPSWNGDIGLFNAYQSLLDEADIFDREPTFRKNCLECKFNQDCSFRMITGIPSANVKEKMQQFPKYNFFTRFKIAYQETKKYIAQLKRYKQFNAEYKEKKAATPTFKIVGMI